MNINKQILDDGSYIIRNSGFEEGMMRANFQLQDEKIVIDQSDDDVIDRPSITKSKSIEVTNNTEVVSNLSTNFYKINIAVIEI